MRVDEIKQIVKDEIVQKKEEGYDVADVEERFLKTEIKTESELKDFFNALEKCPPRSDFPYKEPSDLQEIVSERLRKIEKMSMALSDEDLFDKIYGGWLGRCAGCLLGKPVEGLNREQIEIWLKIAKAYPLEDYFPPIRDLPDEAPKWLRNRLSYIDNMLKKTGWVFYAVK